MRIGINALGQIRGGTLEHLRQLLAWWAELVAHSGDTLTLFASDGTLQRLGSIPPLVRIVPVTLGDRSVVLRIVAEQLILPLLIRVHNIDVLFSPASTSPLFSGTPSVVMLQNAAPFLPKSELRKFPATSRLRLWTLRWFMRASARHAAAVIFLSDTFRRQFYTLTKTAKRLRREDVVIYHARPECVKIDAIEADNCIRTLGIIRPYLLCVSHVYPYKNLVELITAFELIESDTMQLVLVGEAVLQERYFTEVKKAAERASRYPQQVLLTGALSREQVGILLQECMAFVFPSTCENCPIGLVEALAYKLPIACSNVGVMPEIAGKAALLFDPYQPSDIAQTVKMLIMEPDVRADLARKAQDELARFGTPNEVADATWGLLTRVVDSVR